MQYLLMYAQNTHTHTHTHTHTYIYIYIYIYIYTTGGEDMVVNSVNKMYPVIGKMVLCNTRICHDEWVEFCVR